MELIPVDTSMFTMCRLCLEEKGSFLITPNLMYHIKYCFDIDIDPYDGLPQLICQNCETTLSDYSTKKKIFIGRQNALKAKIQVRKEVEQNLRVSPEQDKVSSSQQEESEPIAVRKYKAKRTKSQIISSSSESECDRSRSPSQEKPPKRKRRKSVREPWESFFDKRYACKYCNKKIKGNITNHMKVHANITSKYKDILNRNCSVQLIKLDSQHNITGNPRTVALRTNKILGEQRENTFVIYIPKENQIQENDADEPNTHNTLTNKPDTASVQSNDSDDDFMIKSKTNKRRRLLSTDTVILRNDNITPDEEKGKNGLKHETVAHNNTEIECIDLDDSSNSSSQSNDVSTKISVGTKDVEVIKGIIKVCHNKYVAKKSESSENESKQTPSKDKDPLLKHKLLSMGRKIIKSEGLSCTGLLRYVEHKNLDVKWTPTSMIANKDGNYVRVMPRLKGKNELIIDNPGWKTKITRKSKAKKQNSTDISNLSTINEDIILGTQDKVRDKIDTKQAPITNVVPLPNEVEQHTIANTISQDKSLPQLLICEGIIKQEDSKKLLNANPVANPKQLPKKLGKNYTGQVISPVQSPSETIEHDFIDLVTETPQEDICMPIITSTTSLVEQPANDNTENDKDVHANSTTNGIEKSAPPRLKVKPVSEINSEVNCKAVLTESNNKQVESRNVWAMAPNQLQIGKVYSIPSTKEDQVASDSNDRNHEKEQQNTSAFVIMHTVEMPNTKTDSPFRYIKNLLKIHNIVLLDSKDSKETVPSDFTCLIKFKLQLHKDANTVTLCMSVYCKDNVFYLGVSYPSQPGNIDINTLSHHWQWEILKIYATRDDVTEKMKLMAQKVSPDVHEYTKNFISLLKSIKFNHCI